jgi:hypothetical protein
MSDFRPKIVISVDLKPFEWFINIIIVLSTVLAITELISSESYQQFIYIQCLILGIFISEMVIKYIAFGNKLFRSWNLFDFISVILIIICEILFVYGNLTIVLRLSRIILRSLRFLFKAKQNAEYLAKLDKSYEQIKDGKKRVFTMEELEDLAK